jgi:hypothetical protein
MHAEVVGYLLLQLQFMFTFKLHASGSLCGVAARCRPIGLTLWLAQLGPGTRLFFVWSLSVEGGCSNGMSVTANGPSTTCLWRPLPLPLGFLFVLLLSLRWNFGPNRHHHADLHRHRLLAAVEVEHGWR